MCLLSGDLGEQLLSRQARRRRPHSRCSPDSVRPHPPTRLAARSGSSFLTVEVGLHDMQDGIAHLRGEVDRLRGILIGHVG